MYFVVNKTRPPRPLVISDIKLELLPRQAVDLDKMNYTREQIERSNDLRTAQRAGFVKIQISKKKASPPPAPSQHIGLDADQIRQGVREEMQAQMAALTEVLKAKPEPPQDQEEMKAVLKQLTDAIASGQMGTSITHVHQAGSDSSGDNDDNVDISLLQEIHAKAIDKLSRGVEGGVDFEEKKVEDAFVDERASELEDLLE
jgi:hypothetical protein